MSSPPHETAHDDPIGWFDRLYRDAARDTSRIPWADRRPNKHLCSYLDRDGPPRVRSRTCVVGCGLGDDAELLARHGLSVTAFDVSKHAIDWARERFAGSRVTYHVADLFALPSDWMRAFDFVFESYTIQALPHALRDGAISSVAQLVAPGGRLLVIARGREADEYHEGPPWPLSLQEIRQFESHNFRCVSFEDFFDDEHPPVRRFRAVFHHTSDASS